MPRRCALADETLGERFPGGVAPREALVALGMSHSTISARCRPGKPWQRPIPGVIVFSNAALTRQQLRRAALVHAGPEAVITGVEAARLHGVRRLPVERKIHVLVPHKSGVASWGFAVVERTTHLPEAEKINGLPVAPLARALFDAARHLNRLDEVRAMIADAVQRGLCDPSDLEREIVEGTTIGSALSRRVVHEMEEGVRSATESWARSVVQRSRLPEPLWNARLHGTDNEFLGTTTAYWAQTGVALQLDCPEFHPRPAETPDSARTMATLTAAGVAVIQVEPSQLRDTPLSVIRDLRAAYQTAAGRPPPNVRAIRCAPGRGRAAESAKPNHDGAGQTVEPAPPIKIADSRRDDQESQRGANECSPHSHHRHAVKPGHPDAGAHHAGGEAEERNRNDRDHSPHHDRPQVVGLHGGGILKMGTEEQRGHQRRQHQIDDQPEHTGTAARD